MPGKYGAYLTAECEIVGSFVGGVFDTGGFMRFARFAIDRRAIGRVLHKKFQARPCLRRGRDSEGRIFTYFSGFHLVEQHDTAGNVPVRLLPDRCVFERRTAE